MVRRNRIDRTELQLALHISEIERLQAIMAKITDGRSLVLTPSDPDGGGPTTPPIEGAAHVLYGSKHSRALRVTDNGGISIAFEQGQIWISGTFFSIVAGTLALTDNATNYVFVNNAGAVADNTTGFPTDSAPMAQVTTVAGDITAVADRRAYLSAGAHGGGAVLGNPLTVGVDDNTDGSIWLYGDGAASTTGGAARFYLAADHDTVFDYWEFAAFEDDFRIRRSTGELVMTIFADQSITMQFGQLRLGLEDDVAGRLILYGPGAGEGAEGGEIQLQLAADHDTNFDSWIIDANADDLRFFRSSGEIGMLLQAERQLQIPTTGITAGILLGGDAQLYRSAADVLTIPDQLTVQQQTVGNEVLRLESVATNDNPHESVFQARSVTTDATPVTAHTVATVSDTTYQIETYGVARRTDSGSESGGYMSIITLRNNSGTVTQVGSLTVVHDVDDFVGGLSFGVTGTDILVQVVGEAAKTILWHTTIRVRSLST